MKFSFSKTKPAGGEWIRKKGLIKACWLITVTGETFLEKWREKWNRGGEEGVEKRYEVAAHVNPQITNIIKGRFPINLPI